MLYTTTTLPNLLNHFIYRLVLYAQLLHIIAWTLLSCIGLCVCYLVREAHMPSIAHV